jgi:hypothetical protein
MTSTAAPSVIWLELPAVIAPSGLSATPAVSACALSDAG